MGTSDTRETVSRRTAFAGLGAGGLAVASPPARTAPPPRSDMADDPIVGAWNVMTPGGPAPGIFLSSGVALMTPKVTQAGPNGVTFCTSQARVWEPVSERGSSPQRPRWTPRKALTAMVQRRVFLVGLLAAVLGAMPGGPGVLAQPAGVIEVTTTADAGPGSLRQAILEANAQPGRQTIAFAITAAPDDAGTHLIAVQSLLPPVTDAVAIDGETQGGYSPDHGPVVEISGVGLAKACAGVEAGSYRDFPGLDLVSITATGEDASGTTIRGLKVSQFCEAISVSAEVASAQTSCPESEHRFAGLTITGNTFQDNLGGNAAVDLCNVENSTVRDNRFFNSGDHVEITRSQDVLVTGNEGSGAQDAVELINSHRVTVRDNRFGGGVRGGIVLGFGSADNWIVDNVITGMPASGMVLMSDRNVVEGNVIVGSGWYGIEIRGASGNLIRHNVVADNGLGGIAVYAGAVRFLDECSVGASGDPEACGVIAPIHEGDAFDNVVADNVIAGNGGPGILAGGEFVDSQGATRTAARNSFEQNTIHGNRGPSIHLSDESGSLFFDLAEPFMGAYGEVIIVVPGFPEGTPAVGTPAA